LKAFEDKLMIKSNRSENEIERLKLFRDKNEMNKETLSLLIEGIMKSFKRNMRF